MIKVRLSHPSGMVEIHEWNASKTTPHGAMTCYEKLGITVEILEYRPL